MTRAVRRIHRWRETDARYCVGLVLWRYQWRCRRCGAETWTDGHAAGLGRVHGGGLTAISRSRPASTRCTKPRTSQSPAGHGTGMLWSRGRASWACGSTGRAAWSNRSGALTAPRRRPCSRLHALLPPVTDLPLLMVAGGGFEPPTFGL